MTEIPSFHDVSFPQSLALGASGGPVRRTEIVSLASGHEQRNASWAQARRKYDIGVAIRTIAQLYQVTAFFEARAGRLFSFRFRDPLDSKSCAPDLTPTSLDQVIGTGDDSIASFQLMKQQPGGTLVAARTISKPMRDSTRIAVAAIEKIEGTDYDVDHSLGIVTFRPGHIPLLGQIVSAGFEFDLQVRFDTDEIRVSLLAFEAGEIPSIPIVEVLA